jgi:hypothetical protein
VKPIHLVPRAVALILLGSLGTLSGDLECRGADAPPRPQRSWLNPLRYRDQLYGQIRRVTRSEGAEMVRAILGGSEMGPGDGWFHPGQSRYGWIWLSEHFDADKDGKITRKEFPGDDALFKRLDRNGDGVLTKDDFDWSDNSPFLRQLGMARSWFSAIDSNSNGRISKEEWDAFFKKVAKGKEHLTPDDLREALMPPPPPPSKDGGGGGPSPLILMKGLLSGELGSFHEGPGIGDRAPDFRLKTHDGKQELTLGQFRGKKPVVLVFGSFT